MQSNNTAAGKMAEEIKKAVRKEYYNETGREFIVSQTYYAEWLEKKVVESRASLSTPAGSSEEGEDFEMKRLYEWVMDENRKKANTFFTAGWLRNVAREIEYAIHAAATSKTHESFQQGIDIATHMAKINEGYSKEQMEDCWKAAIWSVGKDFDEYIASLPPSSKEDSRLTEEGKEDNKCDRCGVDLVSKGIYDLCPSCESDILDEMRDQPTK